jgi:deoxyribonuclease-4
MFGSHLSIAGGMHHALLAAERLGCEAVQVFTKNQQQWKAKPLEAGAIESWRRECSRLKFKQTVSHDSYLINLASPDDVIWEKSIETFIEELRRCLLLRIPYLVTHPGAHLGHGEEAGLGRVAQALDIIHQRVPAKFDGHKVITCLEITAGQGSCLGCKLEHLATVMEKVKEPGRLGVCLDTAHLFAAGYDFRGRKYGAFIKEVERTVGVSRVKVWHLNDSKRELGSRVDRHEHIGKGMIGLEGFRPIVRDARWKKVPKIIETKKAKAPDGREWDAVNLEVLRGLE